MTSIFFRGFYPVIGLDKFLPGPNHRCLYWLRFHTWGKRRLVYFSWVFCIQDKNAALGQLKRPQR